LEGKGEIKAYLTQALYLVHDIVKSIMFKPQSPTVAGGAAANASKGRGVQTTDDSSAALDAASILKLTPVEKQAIKEFKPVAMRVLAEENKNNPDWKWLDPVWFDQVQFALWLSRATKDNPHFAEMPSAKGKTLGYILASYILYKKYRNAGQNHGVMLYVTDYYFAERDAGLAEKILSGLGVKVGHFTAGKEKSSPETVKKELEQRQKLYRESDIIYTIVSQPIFDYLGEEMALVIGGLVQSRRRWAVIFDEVQVSLVKEALTPFIISGGRIIDPEFEDFVKGFLREKGLKELTPESQAEAEASFEKALQEIVRGAKSVAEEMRKENKRRRLALYKEDVEARKIFLTYWGERWLRERKLAGRVEHWQMRIENALTVKRFYPEDVEYIRKGGEAVLIGKTGGMLLGRRLSFGLHQAIEAEAGFGIHSQRETFKQRTLGEFLESEHILSVAGGSATIDERALKAVLGGNAEIRRLGRNTDITTALAQRITSFRSKEEHIAEIVREILNLHNKGNPIIVEVESPKAREDLEERLREAGVRPNNIQYIDAYISDNPKEIEARVKKAGSIGMVTIVTSLASLGVDPHLSEEARRQGKTFWAISTYCNESSLDEIQFRKRVGRSDEEKGEWKAFWWAGDISARYLELTHEASGILRRKARASGEEILPVVTQLRQILSWRNIHLIEEVKRRSELVQQKRKEYLKTRKQILGRGLYEALPDAVRKRIESRLSSQKIEELKYKLDKASLSYMDVMWAGFLTKVSQLNWGLGNTTARRRDHHQSLMFFTYPEFERDVNAAYVRLLEGVKVGIHSWTIKQISEITGISKEELIELMRTEKKDGPAKAAILKRFGSVFALAAMITGGLGLYFLSINATSFLSNFALAKIISFFGLSVTFGPGLLVAGAVAIALVVGIVALQRVYLNRIHAERRTGEALSGFIFNGGRSAKGFIKTLADTGYTFSNFLTYISIFGTLGMIALGISMNLPSLLISAPGFAIAGLILAIVTAVSGRKHLKETDALPVNRLQRIVTGVTSGFIFASIVALIAGTSGLAAPVAIILGVGLGSSVVGGIYKLSAKLASDRVFDYRITLASLGLGAALYAGLIFVFSSGIIALPSALFVGKYIFILSGLAAAIAGWGLVKSLAPIRKMISSPIRQRISLEEKPESKIASIAASLRLVFDILASNIIRAIPVTLAGFGLYFAVKSGVISLGPLGIGIIAALTLGFLALAYLKPKYALALITVGIGLS
ncbi:MAG: hypothetical protein DRH17_13595, partial [Deltaproteobacteria bacterium]